MNRILGWDIIRLFSFIAIAYFHFLYICWYQLEEPAKSYSLLFYYLSQYSRLISFSGFSILLLSSILWGFKNKLPSNKFYVFLIIASLGLSYLTSDTDFELSWDIYFLLIIGFISLKLIKNKILLGVLGIFFLWIPFWKLRSILVLPNWLNEIVFGICETDNGDWPILPWIGLIWFGYFLGEFIKKYYLFLNTIKKYELAVWLIILTISILQFGPYYRTKIGPGFACDMFTQPPHVFWSHIVWVLFLMRLSLLSSIQNKFARNKIGIFISNLMISKKFWAAYVIHFIVIQIYNSFSEQIRSNANIGIIAFLLFLPLTELVLQLIFKVKWRLIFKHSPTGQS